MGRTVQDANLSTRSARQSLAVQTKPYWRSIHEGLHVGYRKGKRGGKWITRWYNPRQKTYREETLATADDTTDANGTTILNWKQAQEQARHRAEYLHAEATGGHVGSYTVADALNDYHRSIEQEGRNATDSRNRSALYILPALGKIPLADLRAQELRKWLADVARHPGFTKSGTARKPPVFETHEDEADYRRRRQDSANRILTMLKAALNYAFDNGKTLSNAAWSGKRVPPFEAVSKERVQYLQVDEMTRLINAAAPGFRELVQGALYTGARYGDLSAMDVGDFNADAHMVMSGNSKASKPHPVYLSASGVKFFERITQGRPRRAPMFPHPDGGRWGKSKQTRPMKAALDAARIDTPLSFHGLRHTYASQAVMAGVPLVVVAQNLGHTDTRMVEKHYGHLAKSWVRDQVQAMPALEDPGATDAVVSLHATGKKETVL
jgi:integrase